MKRATLKVESRPIGKRTLNRKLRSRGFVPANVYGPGLENKFCSFDERDIKKIFRGPFNSNTILVLESEDNQLNGKKVIVKSAAKDPVTWTTVHMDFYEVAENREIDVQIPLNFVGTPKGVKLSGGILKIIRREIEVRGTLAQLPEIIDVDISELDVNESIHIGGLNIPEGVQLRDSDKFTVVSVSEAEKEESATTTSATAEAAAATPEAGSEEKS